MLSDARTTLSRVMSNERGAFPNAKLTRCSRNCSSVTCTSRVAASKRTRSASADATFENCFLSAITLQPPSVNRRYANSLSNASQCIPMQHPSRLCEGWDVDCSYRQPTGSSATNKHKTSTSIVIAGTLSSSLKPQKTSPQHPAEYPGAATPTTPQVFPEPSRLSSSGPPPKEIVARPPTHRMRQRRDEWGIPSRQQNRGQVTA